MPHVQPEPASEVISLIGGIVIVGKSGIGRGIIVEEEEADGREVRYSKGARAGPGEGATLGLLILWRLVGEGRGLPGRRRALPMLSFPVGPDATFDEGNGADGAQQLTATAALARVERASIEEEARAGILAVSDGLGFEASRHLHFHRLLHSHGFSKESTR